MSARPPPRSGRQGAARHHASIQQMISSLRTSERSERRPCLANSSGRGHESVWSLMYQQLATATQHLLSNAYGSANWVRHGSTAKHSRMRTPSMLWKMPGFGNRGSSAMYRPALRRPARRACFRLGHKARRYERRAGGTIYDERGQPVAGEPVEVSRSYTLKRQQPRRRGALLRCGAQRGTQDLSTTAIAALQQILANQCWRADAERQRGRAMERVLKSSVS